MYAKTASFGEDEESLLSLSPTSMSYPRKIGRSLRSISIRALIMQGIAFTRPSFMRRAAPLTEKELTAPRKVHPTEYLDGVRGVACLVVFILHWSHIPYPCINSGWGYDNNYSIWMLPYVRLIYSGAAMVAIFFMVSGFVLSHRFIQRMHKHEYLELYTGLTSLTFRRAIRLFLPAFFSSVLAYGCASIGVIIVPHFVDGLPFKHGLTAYIEYLDLESNPWDWKAEFFGFYNPQLWSISVEFKGSMVVFLMLAGLARSRTSIRLAVEGSVVVHAFVHQRWDIALFIAGMFVAELEVLLQKPTNPSRLRLVNIMLVVSLIVGGFLCGYPRDGNAVTPFYSWSRSVWPYGGYRRRFWLSMGAILVVTPMVFMPSFQALFNTRPARYLGKISFALYLVHGLENRTIGKWILNMCWDYIGKNGFWPYTLSYIVSTSLYFPFVIWTSDMFWRAVDVPSTELARKVEKWCSSDKNGR